MKKREVTQSPEALKTQREWLMTAVRSMQEAKRRTKELLDHNIDGWEDLLQDEHKKCLQFDRERWNLTSLISLAEDAITEDTPANEGEAATAEPMEVTAKVSLTNEATPGEGAASVKEE